VEDHLIGGNRDTTLDCRGERTAVVHDDCAGSKAADPCLAPTNQRLAWLEHGRGHPLPDSCTDRKIDHEFISYLI
jgi:hypothetical protein